MKEATVRAIVARYRGGAQQNPGATPGWCGRARHEECQMKSPQECEAHFTPSSSCGVVGQDDPCAFADARHCASHAAPPPPATPSPEIA
jgi:hypothetical protein